jgi:hypothetical protein
LLGWFIFEKKNEEEVVVKQFVFCVMTFFSQTLLLQFKVACGLCEEIRPVDPLYTQNLRVATVVKNGKKNGREKNGNY